MFTTVMQVTILAEVDHPRQQYSRNLTHIVL